MALKNGAKSGAGRPKGSPNKTTVAVKTALLAAFEGIGGVKALTKWANANETEFYKLYAKLLPAEMRVGGDPDNPLVFEHIERRIVRPGD